MGQGPSQGTFDRAPAPRGLRRRDAIVIGIGLAVAAVLLLWPWVLDRYTAATTSQQITQVTSTVDALPADAKAEYLAQARSYNAVLAGLEPELPADQVWPYDRQLTYDRDPMMSWVEIPSIGVSMPIYHGTSEATLMAGVGHLEGTSLPVGGASTHCVLTAHSGMSNTRMFDDVDELEPGDLVLVHTMGDVLAYKVTGSTVVWPYEVDSLGIDQGEDLVTLVTCTPYGVNDHRLLVRCERTSYEPEAATSQSTVASRHWSARDIAAIVFVLVLVVLAVAWAVRRAMGRKGSPGDASAPGGPGGESPTSGSE